jgi:dihydrofolate reductase
MRQVVVVTFVTLDGVMEELEKWYFQFIDEEATKHVHDDLLASDALLMGRETCEGYAAVWPSRAGDEFADRINALPKYVVSTTLEEPLE